MLRFSQYSCLIAEHFREIMIKIDYRMGYAAVKLGFMGGDLDAFAQSVSVAWC